MLRDLTILGLVIWLCAICFWYGIQYDRYKVEQECSAKAHLFTYSKEFTCQKYLP